MRARALSILMQPINLRLRHHMHDIQQGVQRGWMGCSGAEWGAAWLDEGLELIGPPSKVVWGYRASACLRGQGG